MLYQWIAEQAQAMGARITDDDSFRYRPFTEVFTDRQDDVGLIRFAGVIDGPVNAG
jgi:hypothetical protein